MGVLDGLKPERVFRFFEEISQIPRGSGNEKQISDHLKKFAQDRGLECIQDELNNIIIIKEATPGYEMEAPCILQGHMDMVAVKEPDCDIDMTKDPLRLCVKDGRISAEGTSLGGDDGIAVAYILALLDAQDICHPRLEMVITTEEETGLRGADGIDLSMLQGRQLINIDNEEEGVIITSSAGSARVDVEIPVQWEQITEQDTQLLQVKIKGLLGGHSGGEIDKGRGNANCLLGQILKKLAEQFTVRLIDMKGGQADNAIPREAEAAFVILTEEKEQMLLCIHEETEKIKEQLGAADPNFTVLCIEEEKPEASGQNHIEEQNVSAQNKGNGKKLYYNGREIERYITAIDSKRALDCLTALPNGVIAMSSDVEGLVQTSLNLGVMTQEEDKLTLIYAVRSSVDQEKEALCRQMQEIAGQSGASMMIRNSYPGWEYRRDSRLRDKLSAVFEKMYGYKPRLQAIHAGLECGLLAAKIPDLDCASIGPDISDAHTPEESISIDSTARMWEYLLAVLAEKKQTA